MSTGLIVTTITPSGEEVTFDGTQRASSRPIGLQFSTKRGDGFSTCSFSLRRPIDRDYPELALLNDVVITGHDGRVAWEGRIARVARSISDTHTLQVEAVGWISHLKDRSMSEVYVDRDLGGWRPPARAQHATILLASDKLVTSGEVSTDAGGQPALVLKFTTLRERDLAQSWYDIGPGLHIGRLYYDATTLVQGGAGYSATWSVTAKLHTTDDTGTSSSVSSGDIEPGAAAYLAAPTTGYRYAALSQYWPVGSGAVSDGEWATFWRRLAVYGNHGLTLQGVNDPKGVTASDVIGHLVNKYCPRLNTRNVTSTAYAIPHLVFRDTTPFDAIAEVNKYHLYEVAVYENKTLSFQPADLTDYTWQVRFDDPGVQLDLQGDSIEDLANGAEVSFINVQTNARDRVTPETHALLSDTDPDNVVNQAGLDIRKKVELSSQTTTDGAVQIGRAALAEANQPKAPGTITARGRIRDRQGNFQPAWLVRAGDTIAVTNHPNDRPRLVVETQYDHASGTVTIAVDGTLRRLDAFLDRYATALAAGNVT